MDEDSKDKCKILANWADNKIRSQEEDQNCCQQHGGHGLNSQDMQCKSELERVEAKMCKNVPCKRVTEKKCESNNMATAQCSRQNANKMQEKGEEEEREGIECSSFIEQYGGGEERIELDHLVDDARKRRTAGRICNNKESC